MAHLQRPLLASLANADPELHSRYVALESKASGNVLPFVALPDYTDHGLKHVLNVQRNLFRLLPDHMDRPLTPFELFALLSAALLHDVGMMMALVSNESPEQIRLDHFNRSREFVLRNSKELGMTEHQAQVVGEACRAHGMPALDYLSGILYSIDGHGEVRVQLISAFLRLADALDLTADRAPNTVAENRRISPRSRRHWDLHQCISDVQISSEPAWDIRIVAMPRTAADDGDLFRLRSQLQSELHSVYPVLRSEGVFYKKVELIITRDPAATSVRKLRNPFLLLDHFKSRTAYLFSGRDREIQQVIERVFARPVVVVIGESGVGKTSLVEAGVVPQLKKCKYGVVRFSFHQDPLGSLLASLGPSPQARGESTQLLDAVRNHLRRAKKPDQLLLLGDHLEQLFALPDPDKARAVLIEQLSAVLASDEAATFLFCIREDYLPDLYNLSLDLPEVYDRDNTFRLHRLNRDNGREVLEKASAFGSTQLSPHLIDMVVDDLCAEGEGMIYPPFLQIVGYRLYAAHAGTRHRDSGGTTIGADVYRRLAGVDQIVQRYFEGLLDHFTHDEKAMVGSILQSMVTDYYTKKRVRAQDLRAALPDCQYIDRLLATLVNQRVLRRSLDEYELIHDFLARKVVDLIHQKRFLSPPVRKAIQFIERECCKSGVTSARIARAAGITPMHLAALFREQLNCTLNQYLNAARITKAKKLLGSDREPMATIAAMTGFTSPSAFSRKFKQVEGVSPMQYRKAVIHGARQPGL